MAKKKIDEVIFQKVFKIIPYKVGHKTYPEGCIIFYILDSGSWDAGPAEEPGGGCIVMNRDPTINVVQQILDTDRLPLRYSQGRMSPRQILEFT